MTDFFFFFFFFTKKLGFPDLYINLISRKQILQEKNKQIGTQNICLKNKIIIAMLTEIPNKILSLLFK